MRGGIYRLHAHPRSEHVPMNVRGCRQDGMARAHVIRVTMHAWKQRGRDTVLAGCVDVDDSEVGRRRASKAAPNSCLCMLAYIYFVSCNGSPKAIPFQAIHRSDGFKAAIYYLNGSHRFPDP
jgi:hypothetical protein